MVHLRTSASRRRTCTSGESRPGWGFLGVGRAAGRVHRERALRRAGDERGNALVEAVIIIPLLMILTFGCIEFGIGFSQKGGLESVVRSGARVGATLTAENNPGPIVINGFTFPPDTEIGADTMTAVNNALGETSLPELNHLFVYKIDGSTGTSSYSSGACTTSTSCMSFDYNGTEFVYAAGTWPDTGRDACTSGQQDRIGVTIQGTFHFLTGLVGTGNIALNETSVLQLEPTNCG